MARPIRNSKLKTEIFFLIQNFRYNGVEISLRPVHSHLYRILHWWITSSHQRLINALIYQYGRSPHTPKCWITELIALVWPSSETPFMPKATKVASLSFLFESHFIFFIFRFAWFSLHRRFRHYNSILRRTINWRFFSPLHTFSKKRS